VQVVRVCVSRRARKLLRAKAVDPSCLIRLLFARVPSVELLHAVTQLIQAIPFSPGPWRDFVMAAVERDPLREIRKGKIVIEQRREFGTSLVHHRRPITKGEPCVWRENPQKVAVITLTNCLFPDWPLTLCI
jgi:hypothetical protein